MAQRVLELEPLKKKKLELVLVESEFPITWGIQKPETDDWNLRLISDAYVKAVDVLIEKHKPKFAVEELGMRTKEDFEFDNPLVALFQQKDISYETVDIDENALGYLVSNSIEPYQKLHADLMDAASEIKTSGDKERKPELQEILVHAEYLKAEMDAEIADIRTKIREAWMMMGILDHAGRIDESSMTAMFICDSSHFDGIVNLAEQLGIDTTKISMKKSVKSIPESSTVNEFLKASVLEVSPIKIKTKAVQEKILYMFDTDAFASPFDINMAYDAGFNVVIPFAGVTAEKATRLVQDAMFSRKPDAPTCFFVGGSNVKEATKVAEVIKKSLFEPFLHPVVVDPRGSHTTASAVVAKTLEMANKHGWDSIEGKNVVILGTGPVGQIAAIIAAKEHANVTLVETWDQASLESAQELVETLNEEAGAEATPITAAYAIIDEAKAAVVTSADIIWSVAAAGIQILSKDIMEQLSGTKLIVDINAVPPAGVEGMKAKHEDKEIYPGIFGTGALALGGLKYGIESNMLKDAANFKGLKLFNYDIAYENAKNILFGKKVVVAQ
ncbi:MAG TPA: methylene-tetrahydromethanopterin dehydrogenase N-terminal domain-containing protein [Candidatus Lokiarchaeia archaeon]|nr:methylene-tetrahydromethanopterin dehydrogenase N-terminal domain-containing protein [Candidatus Lokiarchaeia archaeon]